jgi:hypothetical protein
MVQILKEEKEKQEKRKLKQKSNGSNNKEGFFVVREGARSRDPPVNVLDTIGNVFTTFVIMLIILAVYILLGYSSACMLTRYAHYIKFELDEKNKGNPKQAFLGINDRDEKGNIIYSSVYCETEEDKKDDEKEEEKKPVKQNGSEDTKKPKSIDSFGIEKDGVVHKLPNIPVFNMLYSYDGSCKDSSDNFLKRIGMNTISGIRSSFRDLFLKFTILSDNTGVPKGLDDKDELFNKQVNRFGFSLIPLYLLIGFIFAIIVLPLGSIFDEIVKFDIIGAAVALVRAPIDMIVYAIYGLIFILGIKWKVRTDFFTQPDPNQSSNGVYGKKYEYPTFLKEYLFSKGNSYILMVWTIVTIIIMSLSATDFELNGYSITSISIGAIGFLIWLYNVINNFNKKE